MLWRLTPSKKSNELYYTDNLRKKKHSPLLLNQCPRDIIIPFLVDYRLVSLMFFPSKNSPNIRSRSSAVYLMYF